MPLLPLVDAALRGAVLALLLLMAVALLQRRVRGPAGGIAVAMACGLAVQVVGSMPWFEAQVPALWQAPFVGISVANAVLFWLFSATLFVDGFRLRRVHGVAWAAAALLGLLNCALLARSGHPAAGYTLVLQRLVAPVCGLLAAWAAVAHWRADLVEWRRRLRGVLVGTGVVYTLVQVGLRMASPDGRLHGPVALADVLVLLLIAGVAAWDQLVQPPAARAASLAGDNAVPPGTLAGSGEGPSPAPVRPASDPEQDRQDGLLAQALEHAMVVQQAYRGEELTITSLAARLDVPEYRLRRLINQRLGHRNFNAFVNGYRLAAARAALADPAQRQSPILGIALDAGFQSIGPFNRAFKAETGLTPSEFRARQLADSGIGQPQTAA